MSKIAKYSIMYCIQRNKINKLNQKIIKKILLSLSLTFLITVFLKPSITFAQGLKLATYNIRNFGKINEKSDAKKKIIANYLKNINADLYALEEVVVTEELNKIIINQFPDYEIAFSKCGGGGHQHIAFLFKRSKLKLISLTENNILASTTIKVNSNGCSKGTRPLFYGKFNIINTKINFTAFAIHLKAGGSQRAISKRHHQIDILSDIVGSINKNNNKNIVLMGDFNTTEYIKKNSYYDHFVNSFESVSIRNITGNVIDCSVYWWGASRSRSKIYPATLDHILISTAFLKILKLKSVDVDAHCKEFSCTTIQKSIIPTSYSQASDHCPVSSTYTL